MNYTHTYTHVCTQVCWRGRMEGVHKVVSNSLVLSNTHKCTYIHTHSRTHTSTKTYNDIHTHTLEHMLAAYTPRINTLQYNGTTTYMYLQLLASVMCNLHTHAYMHAHTYTTCTHACTHASWQLLSNQSFYRQFVGYGKEVGHHRVGQRREGVNLTVIGVDSTMHLIHPNYCQITIYCTCIWLRQCNVSTCLCIYA